VALPRELKPARWNHEPAAVVFDRQHDLFRVGCQPDEHSMRLCMVCHIIQRLLIDAK